MSKPGIEQASDTIAQKITDGITQRATDYPVANKSAIADEVQTVLQQTVTTKALVAIADFPTDAVRSLRPIELARLANNICTKTPEYRQFVAATAQATAAHAKNQLTPEIQNLVTQAKKKLAKAVARRRQPMVGGPHRRHARPDKHHTLALPRHPG